MDWPRKDAALAITIPSVAFGLPVMMQDRVTAEAQEDHLVLRFGHHPDRRREVLLCLLGHRHEGVQ